MLNKDRLITRLAILAISLLLTSAGAINGALPQLQQALQLSTTQSELIATIPALAVVLFVVLSSLIAAKIGTKKTIQLGLILVIIGGLAPTFLTSYPAILASRFILGAGFGLFNSLAVSIINLLFQDEPDTRATLLGYRGAAENIGNAGMTLLAGLLITLNWKFAFGIYLLAIPILIVFTLFVPEIDHPAATKTDSKSKSDAGTMHLAIYGQALFALFLVMTFTAISVRFPTMVASIKSNSFNASNFLAVMPIIGIATGAAFGWFNRHLAEKCLYLGLFMLAISTLMLSLAEHSFTLLLVGYFISGIPGSLIFPFIYNSLHEYASASKMNLATSIILIGCNLGNFASPFGLRTLQALSGTANVFAPFKLLSLILVVILAGIWFQQVRKHTQAKANA